MKRLLHRYGVGWYDLFDGLMVSLAFWLCGLVLWSICRG